jgi:hypothetical protein
MGRLAVDGGQLARWRAGRAWFTNGLLVVFGVALLGLTRQFVAEHERFRIGFSGASGWSLWMYAAAMVVVLTGPVNRWTIWIVLGFAVAFRVVTLRAEPFLSSDIYRYVWDGIVQHAGISPYRYVPGNPVLTFLRGPHQEIFDNINRRDYAVTIYPPAAQMVFWLATMVSPTVGAMKLVMFGFECVTAGALVALLRLMGRRSTDVLVYAWCPLLVWEIGGAGHVDAVVFGFVTLAMLFRYREQPVPTGVFLGLAVMTKFYPLVLLPALWRRGDWKMPATVAAVCAAGYAVYSSAGRMVFGFLAGYQKEEGLESGARFFLLEWAQRFAGLRGVGTAVYKVFCVAVLGAIAVWAWRYASTERLGAEARVGRPAFVTASAAMAFAMMLLFSPHYAWYLAWLVPLLALAPNVPMLVYVCAFFYGFTTQWADPGPKMFLLNEWMYAVVGVGIVVGVVLWRWPVGRWFDLRGGGEGFWRVR